MRKGQFIMEFMILLAMAILLGSMYLAVTGQLFFSTSEEQRVSALNDVGYTVQDELMLAESVDDGYVRNFTIPSTADRFTFTISNDATSVTLVSGIASVTYPLPRINGTLAIGRNSVAKNGGLTVTPG